MTDKARSQHPVSDAELDQILDSGADEVARERDPNVRAVLDGSLTDWRAEKAKRNRRPKHSALALRAAQTWQRP